MSHGSLTRLLDGVARFMASLFGFAAHSPDESRQLRELQQEAGGQTDEDLWSVEYEVVGFEGIERAFKTFLAMNRARLARAIVDAISDDKNLPPEVETARLHLIKIGQDRQDSEIQLEPRPPRRRKDPHVGIELDLREERQYRLFETFGTYSIAADAYFEGAEDDDDYVLSVHDSGSSLLLRLDDPVGFRAQADLPQEGLVDLPTAQRLAKQRMKRGR